MRFAILFTALVLAACNPVQDVANMEVVLASSQSVSVFQSTLYPTLRTNCAACHGVNQAPLFAVDDPESAHLVLISQSLVSLSTPANSRVVQKIRGSHSGIAVAVADQMENKISSWTSQLQAPAPAPAPSPAPMPTSPAPAVTATFSSISSKILVPKCLGCHSSGSPNYSNYTTTRNTGRVVAGNALGSRMYTSCTGPGNPGGQMPPGAPLNSVEQIAIRDWINAGAQNN